MHETKRKRPRPSSSSSPRSFLSTASRTVAGVTGSVGILLASQALYVAISTPRLPPPPKSGHDFEDDGLVVHAGDDPSTNIDCKDDKGEGGQEEGGRLGRPTTTPYTTPSSTFNLVLLGDSPVEGIGNDSHDTSLGGQTALAFSQLLSRPVRYWSFGKSGLTAKGIQQEMVPLLRKIAKKRKYRIDAVILSMGVNNVLSGHSASTFRSEINQLLNSTTACCNLHTKIILLELIDFAWLPFLPWPLSKVSSWRSCILQKEMESVVERRLSEPHNISIASFPNISDLLRGKANHNLLDYMTKEERKQLQLSDFYADDNFHPASHGNILIGKIIAEKYREVQGTIF